MSKPKELPESEHHGAKIEAWEQTGETEKQKEKFQVSQTGPQRHLRKSKRLKEGQQEFVS